MSKFTDQVHLSINGFTKNVIYYDLNLSQKMVDHHYFSFVWQYSGKAIITPEEQVEAIGNYMGNEVIFTFKVGQIRLMSKGIIKGLDTSYENGSPIGLHVTGISHTVVLEDMKKSRIFLDKNLQEIALELFAEESSGEFYQRQAILPVYTQRLKYKTQYNQSSFDFLKRLAARYGEWLYFDGMRMQFGQTKTSQIKLINGASLHKFKIQTRLVSHKTSFGGYDYNAAAGIRNAADKTTTGSRDRFASIAGINQREITGAALNIGAYTNNAQSKDEIEQMVKLQTAGRDANSVFYSGISYLPIGLGQVFTIQNATVEHELVAIEIIHHSEVNGNYTCEFKAIPADVAAPHYTDVESFVKAESQPAKIKDNNDPEAMGRVKVEFFWTSGSTVSDWMRVALQYSGDGRGYYSIPEIGDEVRVDFEGGNVDCPYVSGAHHNGQEKSGYATQNNDLKVWQTRSGNRIISDDDTGDITIESQKGETIVVVHGDGNIRFKAPKNIEFEAGEDFIVNAGKNIITNAGTNISENATIDKTTTVGGILNTNVTGDHMLNVTGSFVEYIEGDYKSHTENERKETSEKGIESSSNGEINKHSEKEIQNNSGEKSKSH